MTAIRKSVVFGRESKFKGGASDWIAPPPGTFISCGHNRTTSRINTTGSKTFDTMGFGQMTGSWEWSYTFDYDYLEPLLLAFEKYSCEPVTDENGKETGMYKHTFSKANNYRVGSFCIREKVLNVMAGGPEGSDEMVDRYGAVVKTIRFNKTSAEGPISVTQNGFYCDEKMQKGELTGTDFTVYDGHLAEFMCMFIGDEATADNYVAMTETLNVSLENNASAIPITCTPFAGGYHEGLTQIAFSTTAYSNDPSRYKQRVYSGGFDNTALRPMSKNMAPIKRMILKSYNATVRDADGNIDLEKSIAGSTRSVTFIIDDCVIKSLTWQKGDGSKLQDQISSAECRNLTIEVVNDISDITKTNHHKVTSNAPGSTTTVENPVTGEDDTA